MGRDSLGLDFSGLLEIGQARATREAVKDFEQGEHSQYDKNFTTGQIETIDQDQPQDSPKYYEKIEKERANREFIAQVRDTQAENVRRAGALRGEITKGIRAGQDPYILLLEAIECISKMTGDSIFYEQNEAQLKTIYGALGYFTPIEQELKDTRGQLEKLLAAHEREPDPARRTNLYYAIKEHQDRETELIAQLQKADK